MMQAVLVMGWFGAFRAGEMVVKAPFDPRINLALGDITFEFDTSVGEHCVNILLKSSKMDPFRHGCMVTLYATGMDLCPYMSLKKYMWMRSQATGSAEEPLFQSVGREALSRHMFLRMLHNLLIRAGLDPTHYFGHSFEKAWPQWPLGLVFRIM
jgi:hypothetical protein